MIDFHAHIIPGIDDGAKTVHESVDMLRMLSSQGINKVVATPHFYPGEITPEEFFKKREEGLRLILDEKEKLAPKEELPKIAKGAEFFFFPLIYSFNDIEKFCIEGTDYLLLEMPFVKWHPSFFDSLHKLITNRGITPIIAHIDRYFSFGNGKNEVNKLKELGALLQINAEAFNFFLSRRKALSLVKKSVIDVIGSDCHNLDARKPEIDKAIFSVKKRLGKEQVTKIATFSEEILANANFF